MAKNTVRPGQSHVFSQVAEVNIKRSVFDLSCSNKTAINSGKIYPVYFRDVVPGDTFNLKTSSLVRLNTPITPFMDNIYVDTHFFFVPFRLVWENWTKFMGERDNPNDSIDYVMPQVDRPSGGYGVETIYDYMGLPINVNMETTHSLRLRAYNLIWNEWYRDQNLQDSVEVPKGDGTDNHTTYKLLRRGKRHDYFTSCLPAPQKGDDVTISLGNFAPVVSDGSQIKFTNGVSNASLMMNTAGSATFHPIPGATGPASFLGTQTGLQTDLSAVSGISINALREAVAIQTFLEKDARYGTRYIELNRAHFGVISSDARLQRPEYLGGGSHPIQINPVTQQSASNEVSPQGNLGAFGQGVSHGIGFIKSFEEHGVILGLTSIRADMTYQQGLDRELTHKTRYDFYFPEFAHLGEQAVLNKEIVTRGNAEDDDVFGYQERYAEMRFGRNIITGKMRSAFSGSTHQSLDIWHLAQKFSDSNSVLQHPHLNADFIEERPPISRIIAVQDEPEFKADFWFDIKATRPLPTYSTPNLVPRI